MSTSIKKEIMTFLYAQKLAWKDSLAFRSQTILWFFVAILGPILEIVLVSVMYTISKGFPGWSYYQVLGLVGISNMSTYLVFYLTQPQEMISSMKTGGIDILLTKPINSVVGIISRYSGVRAIGGVISGLILLIFALTHLQVSILNLIYGIIIFIFGMICIVLFVLAISMVIYIFFKRGNFISWFIGNMQSAVNYPLSIFGGFGILIFTVLLPFGLATFYPAEIIFGKIDYISGLFVIAIALGLSYAFYRFIKWTLREKYTSGGG